MLDDDLKKAIQKAYSEFLEHKGWEARYGQKQMVAEIARTIAGIDTDSEGVRTAEPGGHICVVEAGTGTGKTIAYCLAAIPVAKQLKKSLIISTATVALQEQIILRDLPDLLRSTGLEFSFALAKGRARYLCPARLDAQLEGAELDANMALYPDEAPQQTDEAAEALYQQMLDTLSTGEWDGDRDSWQSHVENEDWFRVTTDHNQCAGRRCAYISQCPFYKARDDIQGADVVVANHDLVLADFSLGGGAILTDPEQTIYVFDEGHHLADKAVQHFSCHGRVQGSINWLKQADKSLVAMSRVLSGIGNIGDQLEKIADLSESTRSALSGINHYVDEAIEFAMDGDGGRGYRRTVRHRFSNGIVPTELSEQAGVLSQLFLRLSGLLEDVSDQLREVLDDNGGDLPRHEVELWFPAVGSMQARSESAFALWQSFAKQDDQGEVPKARWIVFHDNAETGNVDFEFCSSPIQSADTLYHSIWKQCFSAVVTSATLTALNSFDRFRWRSGTPESANYLTIPSPFDFSRAVLSVPSLNADPRDSEAHTEAVSEFVVGSLEHSKGSLVLFSSRKQMEDVFYSLDRDLRQRIIMQGDLSKQEMVVEHRKRIDEGAGSILFGLASFAEGVDLPGDYCTHVVIAKIPFAVPDDPVEEAISEWIEKGGGNPFMEISVPDAAMKLVQASGRLLRSEKDSGRITLLDRRIVTSRYGKLLLSSLPPYRREIA